MRYSSCERETNETRIKMSIDVDGAGVSEISTGIGFFDHMLTHVSKHGFMDIKIKAEGDIEVDCHHTVEDVGIVFGIGESLAQVAFGKQNGIPGHVLNGCGGHLGANDLGHSLDSTLHIGEGYQKAYRDLGQRDQLQNRFADNTQRTFRTDHQILQTVTGTVLGNGCA